MVVVAQKSLANGKVYLHFSESWDELKNQLISLDEFSSAEWEAARFGWEALFNGDIISDGAFLWQYLDLEEKSTDIQLFEGGHVLLIDIDPVFD